MHRTLKVNENTIYSGAQAAANEWIRNFLTAVKTPLYRSEYRGDEMGAEQFNAVINLRRGNIFAPCIPKKPFMFEVINSLKKVLLQLKKGSIALLSRRVNVTAITITTSCNCRKTGISYSILRTWYAFDQEKFCSTLLQKRIICLMDSCTWYIEFPLSHYPPRYRFQINFHNI